MADFINVNQVLENLSLKNSMMAVEFGCGSADFTIALAKKLSHGRVVAIDIQEEKLSVVKSKALFQSLNNIATVLADLEAPGGSTLKDASQDVVLIPNVLFQAENKSAIITEARRILKLKGILLIIDWLKIGPFSPKKITAGPDEVKKIVDDLGFSLKKELAVGDYHYALILSK